VLVQPSEDENFGSAVAEALACGTPVVLGSSNGTGDYAKSGAIRFDQYEANAVAAAIALAITKADALREPARQAAELHLDPKTIALGLEKILIQALLAWPSKREPSHSMAGKSSFVPDLNPSGS
jgi:glycosyltransferase involved in cell wall biosynthesis